MRRSGYAFGTVMALAGGVGLACGDTGDLDDIADTLVASPEEAYAAPTDRPPTDPPKPNSETRESLERALPEKTPSYFKETYISMMGAPTPAKIYELGGIPVEVPQLEIDRDPTGHLGSFQPGGPTLTATNAFFQSLGTNGRSCVTCHQPPSGMGVSVRNIKKRLAATHGTDPIFAPVDGANCPNQVQRHITSGSILGGRLGDGMKSFEESHSLLLEKGLIRIMMPVPSNADFTIEVVSDPTTCNVDPVYSTTATGTRIVSVFRRPLISAAMRFKEEALAFPGPPLPPPLVTNNMSDGREADLFQQAIGATMGHAQATKPPSETQLAQIVAFERGIFSAQIHDNKAGLLTTPGVPGGVSATGGPLAFASHDDDPFPPAFGGAIFDEYGPWAAATGARAAHKRSIARGQALFLGTGKGQDGTETRGTFTISNVRGFNDAVGPNVPGNCSTCHNVPHAGNDFLDRSQRDIGTGGHGAASPLSAGTNGPPLATDLPIFKITCVDELGQPKKGQFLWDPELTTVTTNDPSKALFTGKCSDVGARTVPTLRGLAAREPYFLDGSAKTLLDLVNVYDTRFSIGFTPEEKADLVNFLNAL